MPSIQVLSLAALACIAAAQDASSTSSAPTSMETGVVMLPAEVENCHAHGTDIFCFAGEEEWQITSDNAAEYDGQSLSSCTAGTAEDSLSCEATDGSDVVLVQEAGEEEDHDHTEEDHSASNSTAAAVPTEVENCHSHEDGIYCFAGEDEWEVTSENAADYDGQSLTACEAGASSNTTITCNSEDGSEVTLAAHSEEEHSEETATEGEETQDTAGAQNTTTTEEDSATTEESTEGEEGAGSAIMASVGFSMVGLVLATFVL